MDSALITDQAGLVSLFPVFPVHALFPALTFVNKLMLASHSMLFSSSSGFHSYKNKVKRLLLSPWLPTDNNWFTSAVTLFLFWMIDFCMLLLTWIRFQVICVFTGKQNTNYKSFATNHLRHFPLSEAQRGYSQYWECVCVCVWSITNLMKSAWSARTHTHTHGFILSLCFLCDCTSCCRRLNKYAIKFIPL